MVVAWKQKLAERQTEISQKSIDKLVKWLEDFYSTFSEKTIESFMKVYNQMRSSLEDKQKSTPADLYKLDSYWMLQKNTKSILEIAGKEIYSQLNSQLKIMYADIYEGIAPEGNESPCLISEAAIEELINLPWGAERKSTEELIWLYMTLLWDRLFGELMHCTIKNLAPNNLEKRLQDQFKTNKQSLDIVFSDSITHIQGYAAAQRYGDDSAAYQGDFSYLGPYIDTYGNEEEKEAYSLLASNFSLKNARYNGDVDGDLDNDGTFGDLDNDGDISNYEAQSNSNIHMTEWSFTVELDYDTCEACEELAGITWRQYYYGPPPVPVHKNCRCSATPYDRQLSIFGQKAHEAAEQAFQSAGGGVTGFIAGSLVGAAMITLGVMFGDDYSTASRTESDWIQRWGDKFKLDLPYNENNPWVVELFGSIGWKWINQRENPGLAALLGDV